MPCLTESLPKFGQGRDQLVKQTGHRHTTSNITVNMFMFVHSVCRGIGTAEIGRAVEEEPRPGNHCIRSTAVDQGGGGVEKGTLMQSSCVQPNLSAG